MKFIKKVLSILIIFSILLTNFMPSFMLTVKAEQSNVDTSKPYKLYMYYP